MKVELIYGSREIDVDIPDKNVLWELWPNDLPPVADEEREIRHAILNPLGCERLGALVKPGMKVVILADDLTRPTPKKRILPILLDELNRAGVPDIDITVLIALGTHRYMTEDEILKAFGNEIISRVRILNHEWMGPGNLVTLGRTENGTPITVNKVAYDADFLIGLGSIVPHCWAGFSGGAKIIQPGISGPDTTAATHHLIFDDDSEVLSFAGMAHNKVMNEMRAVARQAGLDFIVNVVVNSKKEVVKVVAGDLEMAHNAGIEASRQNFVREISQRADIVIEEAYPADFDMWQATKPLSYSRRAVKDGGTVIFLTAAPDGICANHPFLAEQGRCSYSELKDMMLCDQVGDRVAGSLLMLIKKGVEGVNVIAVSDGLTREMKWQMAMEHAGSMEEALRIAFARHGKDATVGIIHHGGDVLPVLS
ncbi:MAG: nickel-dependent lactate racemase [Methanomassiliicoccales archaeon]|nr:nickel-dependent lactate racemase [Methanomassiliicoccales archaeon]